MTDAPQHHSLLYRKVVLPLLALLRMGATPEKLAWSLAIGCVIGINPLLGSTTILCLAVIFALRLNTVAGQLGNHLMYPLELLLVIPFIRAGERLFHTAPLPILSTQIFTLARKAPVATVKLLWQWEWHALVVWAMCSVVLTPALALILTPVLRHSMSYRERQKQKISLE
jgi:uncharacterized protein (DUF2062 family)